MNQLIIVSGPTATFKTKTSIDIALRVQEKFQIPTVIVNFDSLLFYKEISIGTAKPSLAERKGILHLMIDIASIKSPINAFNFVKMAENIIKEELLKNKLVILVGGSAFYLRALLKGMYEEGTTTPLVQEKFDQLYAQEGIAPIMAYLKIHDPESLLNLHPNDHYRLTRAAIYFEMSGCKISSKKILHDQLSPYDFTNIIHPFNILHLYLDLPKDIHFEIIKKRTEKMFNDGLIAEIENLSNNGFNLDEKPLHSIGYKEIIDWKNGLFKNQKDCMERIAISTRQLAKSQRTFFKKISPKLSFNPLSDQEKIIQAVESFKQENSWDRKLNA